MVNVILKHLSRVDDRSADFWLIYCGKRDFCTIAEACDKCPYNDCNHCVFNVPYDVEYVVRSSQRVSGVELQDAILKHELADMPVEEQFLILLDIISSVADSAAT